MTTSTSFGESAANSRRHLPQVSARRFVTRSSRKFVTRSTGKFVTRSTGKFVTRSTGKLVVVQAFVTGFQKVLAKDPIFRVGRTATNKCK